MKIFLAGSTGVVGRNLVPLLLESGHEVIALVRTPEKARALEVLGATVAIADALDKDQLTAVIKNAKPEVIPIVGDGGGVWSFIHVSDAARATAVPMRRPNANSAGSRCIRVGAADLLRGLVRP